MIMTTGPQARYFAHLAEDAHRIQHCAACDRAVFYPRIACPHCSGGLDWIEPSGKAVVYSATTVRRAADDGGDYTIALVDLAEGVRLMTRIVDAAPGTVCIGMPVRFAGIGADRKTVLYAPGVAA
jgi:uncharacterized OB-fold protein